MVGKCVSKENPKSDLDLDLGFVNIHVQIAQIVMSECHYECLNYIKDLDIND